MKTRHIVGDLVLLVVLAIALLTAPAFGQEPEKIVLTVTRQQLSLIGRGVMELPYKDAVGVMNDLQQQLTAHDAAMAAKAKRDQEPAPVKDQDRVESAK